MPRKPPLSLGGAMSAMTPAPSFQLARHSFDKEQGALPIEMVDELPAAWRKRNTIIVTTLGDNASPMLAIKKT